MGGSNDKNNIVNLTFKEHFIVHLLLTKMCVNPKDKMKMFRAIVAFQRYDKDTQQRKITSRQYNIIKKYSKLTNTGRYHPNYGKSCSEETKRKISKANMGPNNGMFGKTYEMSERRKESISAALMKSEKLKSRGQKWKSNISKAQSKDIVFVSIETEEIVFTFPNCREAAEYLGCNKSNITNALRTDRIVGKRLKSLPRECFVRYA